MLLTLNFIDLATIAALICVALAPSRQVYGFPIWLGCLTLAVVLGIIAGLVEPLSVTAIAVLAVMLWQYSGSRGFIRLSLWLGSVLLCFALGAHVIPGFEPVNFYSDLKLGDTYLPINIRFGTDKAIVGVLLLRCVFNGINWRISAKHLASACVALLLIFSVLWPTVLHFDFKVGWYLVAFLLTNLFVACLAEEAFFRGLIQGPLTRFATRRYQHVIIVISVGLAFAALHPLALQSITYGLVFGFVGIVYAAAFQYTRRIEVSVLLHFFVNLIHIICFQYPLA